MSPASPNLENTSRLLGVQYLRAIAALMVTYFHLSDLMPEYATYLHRHMFADLNLATGVDLFFVISGFIILISSRRATPGAFLVRRIIRIVPLYWLLTMVLAVLFLWRPALFRNTALSPAYFAKSLLFIPYANPAQHGQMFPLLVPGWSLNMEMFFYVTFAWTLFAPLTRRIAMTSVVFVAFILTGYMLRHMSIASELRFFMSFRLFEFLFGMIIANLYMNQRLRWVPAWLALSTSLCGFVVLLWGLPLHRVMPIGGAQMLLETVLPAAMMVFGVVSLEQGRGIPYLPFAALLGDASYSMYLSHIFSLGAVRILWTRSGLLRLTSPPVIVIFVLLALLATTAVTLIIYRLLEKPMLEQLQQRFARYRSRRHVPNVLPQIKPAPASPEGPA